MHEVRFPNIYIRSYIVYYINPLPIIIVLVINAVGFSKSEKLPVQYLKYIMVKPKIKYKCFIISD